ncbi:hypothetical protein NL108_015603 [Boleophthalmus pectinirostris]|nr:hypothetical protein NL108_015603 [Boleophthalmus pectinirostris]
MFYESHKHSQRQRRANVGESNPPAHPALAPTSQQPEQVGGRRKRTQLFVVVVSKFRHRRRSVGRWRENGMFCADVGRQGVFPGGEGGGGDETRRRRRRRRRSGGGGGGGGGGAYRPLRR